MKNLNTIIASIIMLFLMNGVVAQPGIQDTTFNTAPIGGQVFATAIQSNGKILIGGRLFNYNNGGGISSICRLNVDGSLDNTFNTGGLGFHYADSNHTTSGLFIWDIDIQQDDKIIVCLEFEAYSNASSSGDNLLYNNDTVAFGFNSHTAILRLNQDGSLDNTFNAGHSGFSGRYTPYPYFAYQTGERFVLSSNNDVAAIQSDGKILIKTYQAFKSFLGYEVFYNNSPVSALFRLNTDGSLDTTFHLPNLGDCYTYYSNMDINEIGYAYISALAIQPNGKIVVAVNSGVVYPAHSPISPYIVRLNIDGSIDSSFIYSFGVSAEVMGGTYISGTLAIQSNGKILFAGDIGNNYGLLRLNTNGDIDSSFLNNFFFYDHPHELAIQSDGKILVGLSGSNERNNPLRLYIDGSEDTTFNASNSPAIGAQGNVDRVVVQSDGKIIISGGFDSYVTSYNYNPSFFSYPVYGIARLNNSCGATDTIAVHHTACNEYTLNNSTLTQSGTYYFSGQNVYGCDTVATLHLTINQPTVRTQTVSACDSYMFGDNVLTQSGTYYDTLQNAVSCDSTIILHLAINHHSETSIVDSICADSTYIFNGRLLTATGIYYDTLINTDGCDSTISLILSIKTSDCDIIIPTGIADIAKNNISVYPNPFTDKLTIEPKMDYQLFDLIGREVDKNNLSALPVGTYILQSELGTTRVAKIEK